MKGYKRATEYHGSAPVVKGRPKPEGNVRRRPLENGSLGIQPIDDGWETKQCNGEYHGSVPAVKWRPKPEGNIRRRPLESRTLGIQPIDDGWESNQFNGRHMAAARFHLNNQLVAELFSPNIVPDARTLVTRQRLEILQRKSADLQAHIDRINQDIIRLEQFHEAKVRAIQERSEQFNKDYMKICESKPQVDPQQMEHLIERWIVELGEAYEKYKQKQDEEEAKRVAIMEQSPMLSAILSEDQEE